MTAAAVLTHPGGDVELQKDVIHHNVQGSCGYSVNMLRVVMHYNLYLLQECSGAAHAYMHICMMYTVSEYCTCWFNERISFDKAKVPYLKRFFPPTGKEDV